MIKMERLTRILRQRGFKGEIKINENLSKYTTFKTGGPADLAVFPENIKDIITTVILASGENIPLTVLGNGSNVLIRDGGIRGIVLFTSKLKRINVNANVINAEGGVTLPKLAAVAARFSLSGLEFAAGIPGTLGGALVINAGADGKSIGNLVKKVTTIDTAGQVKTYNDREMGFSYRKSALDSKGEIVAKATLELNEGNYNEIIKMMHDNLRRRKEKQPLEYPNAGSIFKNPPGYAAGYLLEKCGCKGEMIGAVQVSEKHANFIINLGKATSSDILQLIERLQKKVLKNFGITLELEVKVLGED